MKPRDILIVEDVAQSREWLASLVRSVFPDAELHLVGLYQQAEAILAEHPVNLALVDIHLPDGDGIDLLRRCDPEGDIFWVITTVFADDDHLFNALRSGARGYLLKEHTSAQIIRHLAGILDGQPPLSPRIANRVLQHFQPDSSGVLTDRECEVLKLISQGLSQKATAKELHLSAFTVGDHIKHIYQKLRVHNRASAIAQASRMGILKQ